MACRSRCSPARRPGFSGKGEVVKIDGAKVIRKNVRSQNSVTHVVNAVMIPRSIERALAN